MKFDPFGTAWKEMNRQQQAEAEAIVAAVREAVGDDVDLMIEVHGRLSVTSAIEMGRRLIPYRPAWYEEPVTPHSLDQLLEVKHALPFPMAAGERLYMLEEFGRLATLRACDVVQMDLAHCGGLRVGKKNRGTLSDSRLANFAALLNRSDRAVRGSPFRLVDAAGHHSGELCRVRCVLAKRSGVRLEPGSTRKRRICATGPAWSRFGIG